ncbi:MAG: carotenoid oxygenase family protein [Pseudomonadales bacterium]|nr:carotenoid oxygenase family protein [Pseudomonadales bacterium]
MNRRRLLCGFFGGLAAASAAPVLAATSSTTAPHPAPSLAERFRAGLRERPWLRALLGTESPALPPRQLALEGRLPEGLMGVLYRNGPARQEIGDFRYGHWFDGDGMVHRWRIGADGVEHRARMVHTTKYLAERDAGRPLYPGFGTAVANGAPVSGPDSVNVANISVLPRGEEVWALWEAGSPWRLDAESLETLGVQSYSPQTRGLPFSAHPRVAPDGTIWNFGYASGARRLVFWRIDPDGSLGRVTTLPVEATGMPHDFVVTHRHLVLLIPPLHYEPDPDGPGSFLDGHVWHPERPTKVLVMELADLETHFWAELPAQWVFHYGNAFEDADGVIRFDGASAAAPDKLFGSFRAVMGGEAVDQAEASARPVLFRIDTRTRRASQEPLAEAGLYSEFPVVDPRRSTQRHRWVTTLTEHDDDPAVHGWHTTVTRLDLETGARSGYRYPDEELPEEHLYVPDPDRDDEAAGWLVGTSLDWKRQRTHLNVFRADALADGPIARATLPELLPLGLHGRFAAGAQG